MQMKKAGKSAKKKKSPPPSDKSLKEEKEENESKGFDFGGLPDRDLKKNLGCG